MQNLEYQIRKKQDIGLIEKNDMPKFYKPLYEQL